MTEAELKKHIEAAEKSPKLIATAVSGLPGKTLSFRPSPDKWCILEILGHLADMEVLYSYRMRQMLADAKPVIAPIDQDAWAKKLHYMESSPVELVAFYGIARHANLQLLRKLKPEDLDKSAYHPERKADIKVEDLVRMMAVHGDNHLQQIERLKKAAK